MRLWPWVALAIVFAVCQGCQYPFAPPVRPLVLESPSVLARGETGIVAEGAWHATLWEGGMETGTLRARHGFGHRAEGSVETTYFHYDADRGGNLQSTAIVTRTGAKICLVGDPARCALAALGGLGGGTYDGGGLAGADVGLTTGYENRYLVPFLAARASVSVPIGPIAISEDALGCSDPCSGPSNKPLTTFGIAAAAGVRIPFDWLTQRDGARRPTRASVVAGAQMSYWNDGKGSADSFGFGGAIELVF